MTIRDEFQGFEKQFIDNFAPESAAGSAGEALLAVALGAYRDELRKRAKDLLKKAKQARLNAALKLLPRRNYAMSGDGLAADLESVKSIDGLDVAQLAFHLHQLHRSDQTPPFFAAQVPADYLRRLFEAELVCQDGSGPFLHQTPWPAALLFPLVLEHPEVRVLALNVLDEAEVPDLSSFTELEKLNLSGPLTAIPAGALDGTKLTHLNLQRTRVRSLEAATVASKLQSLIYSQGPLDALPALSTWPLLTDLTLKNCELRELPPSLGALGELRRLLIDHCPLRALPEELGALPKLEHLCLFDLHLESLPTWANATPPAYVSTRQTTLPEHCSPTAFRFLKLPSAATLLDQLKGPLDGFAKLPLFAAALRRYRETGDIDGAKIPEMLVAVSRVYVDDEHGPSSNTWLAGMIAEHGGPLEQTASKALPAQQVTSPEAILRLRDALSKVRGFDVEAFVAFATQGLRRG